MSSLRCINSAGCPMGSRPRPRGARPSHNLRMAIDAADTKPEAPAPEAPVEPAPERATSSGIPVAPFYAPEDVAGISYPEAVGDPGERPYTRGLYPDMYRARRWTMRQYAG